jgi:hypothetical protein
MNWSKFDKKDKSTWPEKGRRFKGRFIVGTLMQERYQRVDYDIVNDIRNLTDSDLDRLTYFKYIFTKIKKKEVE